jgi:hypothetical protein
MKQKDIKLLALLFITLFLGACNKELNVYPTTSEVDGNVIVDAKSASTLLNGVYYRFANAGVDNNGVPSLLWTGIQEVFPSELCGSLNNSSGDDGIYSFKFNATSTLPSIWNYGYALVNAANGFLSNIDPVTTVPAATKKQMQAEAMFLRAFGNAELLLYYGQYNDMSSKYGIILRDAFVSPDNINLQRSTVADVYKSILADLDDAIANLPATNTKICYTNASAAKLLKARVLINRGAAGDYAQVISLTDDIIKNGSFVLEDNVKDIFLTKGFSSKEVILGVQPFPTENYKYQQNQYYNQYVGSSLFQSLLNNDPRNLWVYKSSTTRNGSVKQITKYYTGNPITISPTALANNCYAFRLTEAYLLEAEAITLSNGDLAKAKTLLTTVLSHAGITDFTVVNNTTTAADLQVLIVKEEVKNFFAENGADWFALRRLPFATIQTIQPAIKSVTQLILPIPMGEITTNKNMIQNPGY